jgi:hypothetical protein
MILALLALELLSATPSRFALVVGSNAPLQRDLPMLRYADDDAIAMAQMLREIGADVHLLVDADADTRAMHPQLVSALPTRVQLEAEFAAINDAMGARRAQGGASELVIYYSGHGDVRDGDIHRVRAGVYRHRGRGSRRK